MAQDKPQKNKGLLAVFTGNGKGKTTASLGLAFRALGHGQKVCIIQFIKGSWKYGELESAKQFSQLLDFHVMGRGFTWKSDDLDRDKEVALEAWEFAKKVIKENNYSLVILDELTYLPHYKMIEEQEILSVLGAKPEELHVVVTGRYASDALIEMADLVTEMVEVKHPFQSGIKAQRGFEF
ncbi:MAG: cob(I)yrinic acid a,c-diamide adenosyltransferase [Desulfocapsa sp.]|uniref:corrinoid adenosyltransferase n=1 Tax=Desulfotalea psychrophila TaxID=84980 RepID=A0ABS3AY73_9BACT|nr:cob(I)yrinic acid a,c-diamide adenosyltransferase [Desulfocapsa sp.]MBN4063881.1 cob(I)yrinic acid a,c-diamide adenosyltransferase [bacterium AH-315-I07]MBN4068837.1 cob(I)yrinic acid a,c-diamide adenosyltransferase [Desulfotalea psychrophila]